MNWFRFYGDALRDAKLRKVARLTGQPFAQVLGIWAAVLCFASDSHERGVLWIAPAVPVTDDDVAEAVGCNVSETLRLFQDFAMLTVEDSGAYVVVKWSERQYVSDSSTERVREHRIRQKAAPELPKPPAQASQTPPAPVPVTLQQHSGNAPDTDTELIKDDDDARARAGAIRAYENAIGFLAGAHQAGEMQAILAELQGRGVLAWWDAALRIACDNNARKWSYMRAILENSLKTGLAPGAQKSTGRNTHATGKPVDSAVLAKRRAAVENFDADAALARL